MYALAGGQIYGVTREMDRETHLLFGVHINKMLYLGPRGILIDFFASLHRCYVSSALGGNEQGRSLLELATVPSIVRYTYKKRRTTTKHIE